MRSTKEHEALLGVGEVGVVVLPIVSSPVRLLEWLLDLALVELEGALNIASHHVAVHEHMLALATVEWTHLLERLLKVLGMLSLPLG